MILNHIWGLASSPDKEWESIRNEPNTLTRHYLAHTIILAAIPAVSGYIGTTQVGWSVGSNGALYKLSSESAMQLAVLFYIAMIGGVFLLGKFVDFLSATYQDQETSQRGVALASYTSTPLFVVGLVALYPVIWLNMLLVLAAIGYTLYLLFEGIPILMKMPPERGFMFASAIVTVGLVLLIGIMAMTIIFWAVGLGPVFIAG